MKQILSLLLLLSSFLLTQAQNGIARNYVKAGVQVIRPFANSYEIRPYVLIQHAFSDKNLLDYGFVQMKFQRELRDSTRQVQQFLDFRLQFNHILLRKWGGSLYAGGATDFYYEYICYQPLGPNRFNFTYLSSGIKPHVGLGLMWSLNERWMLDVFVPLLSANVSVDWTFDESPGFPPMQRRVLSMNGEAGLSYGIRFGTGIRLSK